MDERVLVPRPDTEVLVEKILWIVRSVPRLRRVLDACTGSGCIGISVKHTAPGIEVSTSDISAPALEVAALNADRSPGSVPAFHSDLLESVPGSFDLIASNPPYLRDDEVTDLRKLGWREPDSPSPAAGTGRHSRSG